MTRTHILKVLLRFKNFLLMKKLLVLLCMSVSVMGFSQEWGGVDKNTVTMKEVAPTWPGCESKSGAGTDACFKQKLAQHIGKNFKFISYSCVVSI